MIEMEILGVQSQVSIPSDQESSQYINDVNELAKILKKIKFFEERKIVEEEDLREIARCLTFETFQRNDVIINYQEEGDKFYLILKGQVSVMIPQMVEVTPEEHEARLKKHEDSTLIINALEKRIRHCNDRLYLFNQAEKYFGNRQDETFQPKLDLEQDFFSECEKREGSVFLLQEQIQSMNFKFTMPKRMPSEINSKANNLAMYTPKKRQNATCHGHSSIVNRLNFHLKNIKKYEPRNFERLKQTMNISPSKSKQKRNSEEAQAAKGTKVFEKKVDDEAHLMQKLEEYTDKDMQKEIAELFSQIRRKVLEINMGLGMLQKRVKDVDKLRSDINLGTHDRLFKTVANLAAGDHFGELALINKKGTRMARIAADRKTVLGVLNRDIFNRVLIKIEKQRKDSLCEFVKEMPFFKSLTKAASIKIVNSLNYQKVYRGHVAAREYFEDEDKGKADYDDAIYFVLSGEFVAILTIKVQNKAQDLVTHHNEQFKSFINLHYESLGKREQIKKTKDDNIQSANNENGGRGYRYILCSDKLNEVTRKPTLLGTNPAEHHEIELVRFGKGQIFGELNSILAKIKSDHDPMYNLAQTAKDCFRKDSQIQIRCLSQESEILRISSLEF